MGCHKKNIKIKDNLLREILKIIGYKKIVQLYDEIDKWFA